MIVAGIGGKEESVTHILEENGLGLEILHIDV